MSFGAYKPTWSNNYWSGHSGLFLKIIRGIKYFEFTNPFNPYAPPIEIKFQWIDIDRNPAREPFTI